MYIPPGSFSSHLVFLQNSRRRRRVRGSVPLVSPSTLSSMKVRIFPFLWIAAFDRNSSGCVCRSQTGPELLIAEWTRCVSWRTSASGAGAGGLFSFDIGSRVTKQGHSLEVIILYWIWNINYIYKHFWQTFFNIIRNRYSELNCNYKWIKHTCSFINKMYIVT